VFINWTSKNDAECTGASLYCFVAILEFPTVVNLSNFWPGISPVRSKGREHISGSLQHLDRVFNIFICVYRASKNDAEYTRASLYCYIIILGFPTVVNLSNFWPGISPVCSSTWTGFPILSSFVSTGLPKIIQNAQGHRCTA
jgi:hypothetical protein